MNKYKIKNIRLSSFWLIDKLKGGLVYEHYKQFKNSEHIDFDIKNCQNEQLTKLINHVNETVPFYKEKGITCFSDFPIVNKVMMKENPSLFLSTADLNIAKIRHTSGSTGIPFKILQDLNKSKRINAEMIYFRELAGDELGNKFINIMAPSKLDNYSKLSKLKQNLVIFDVSKMDDENLENLNQLLLKDKSIRYVLSYASGLDAIANYFYKKGYSSNQYHLNSIVSSSEVLTTTTKEKLEDVFKCKVYDRYSNEDNGFIAQTNGTTKDFIVNELSYIIEIIKLDSNEKAEPNELGRIVITDLYNFAQPFIRYDTGDLGSYDIKEYRGRKVQVLTTLQGRRSDMVYDSEDRPISTFALGCMMEVFPLINQYQIIQHSKNVFELKVNDPNHNYSSENYIKEFKEVLGNDINLSISYVDDIPKLSSGKFKRIICNYKPEEKNEHTNIKFRN